MFGREKQHQVGTHSDTMPHSDTMRMIGLQNTLLQVASECARVLCSGGVYMCISFKAPETLTPLLTRDDWDLRCKGHLTPSTYLYVGTKK
jgi:ubiquinone/menaquinone biosynthesis C-methylase UbiE